MSRQFVQYMSDAIALTTLANNTAIIGNLNIDATREQGVRMKKFMYDVTSKGDVTQQYPIIYGLCIELTAVEVAQALLADPQGIDDQPEIEKTTRKVWVLGTLGNSPSSNGSGSEAIGRRYSEAYFPFKEIPEGSTLKWFVMNLTGAALTGAKIATITATAVQEWLRD